MTLLALALILVAAFLHAGWNLLAKRAGGGAIFVWLFAVLSAALYGPFVLAWMIIDPPRLSLAAGLCIVATAVLHLAYFLALQRGYRVGDLSLVYPLARGNGPLLAMLGATLLFGESPSLLACAGAALIIVGVFLLSASARGPAQDRSSAVAIGYGLLTGTFIASYTLLDKYAVSTLALAPLFYDWSGNVMRALLVTPYALRRRGEIARQWRASRGPIIGVAILSPLAYILVLTAMTFTPVSYVAPAREISILIGVVLGARLLSEGQLGRRLFAGTAMIAGIAALVLG